MAEMTLPIRTEGLERVLNNLNTEVKKIKFKNKQGMIRAGLLVQREAQKLTPVDTGNLKASAFTVWGPAARTTAPGFTGEDAAVLGLGHSQTVDSEKMSLPPGTSNPEVTIGFTAFYAFFVHEDGVTRNWTGKKFLERALQENLARIIAVIREEVKK